MKTGNNTTKKPRGKKIRIVRIVFADPDELTPEERARMEGARRLLDYDVTRILGEIAESARREVTI